MRNPSKPKKAYFIKALVRAFIDLIIGIRDNEFQFLEGLELSKRSHIAHFL
jgi:hypothetical protein